MKPEARKKILIVDDDKNIVETVKIRLEANGYKVVTASDGLEGLEMAKEEKPDLILLNIMMPKLNGIMATLKLKGVPETKSIPVIIMTGINEKDEMLLAKHVGAASYIAKPFDSQELLKRIEKLLSQK